MTVTSVKYAEDLFERAIPGLAAVSIPEDYKVNVLSRKRCSGFNRIFMETEILFL